MKIKLHVEKLYLYSTHLYEAEEPHNVAKIIEIDICIV